MMFESPDEQERKHSNPEEIQELINRVLLAIKIITHYPKTLMKTWQNMLKLLKIVTVKIMAFKFWLHMILALSTGVRM